MRSSARGAALAASLAASLAAALTLLLDAGCAGAGARARFEGDAPFRRRWPVMGTYAQATVWAPPPAAARTLDALRAALDAADLSLSNWKEESALSRLNEEARRGLARPSDPLLEGCVGTALDGAAATSGAFDPTVGPLVTLWGLRPGPRRTPSPQEIAATLDEVGWEKVHRPGTGELRFTRERMEVDLGGIGKGCALDAALAAVGAGGEPGAAGEPGGDGVSAGIVDLGRSFGAWGIPPEGAWRLALAAPGDAGDLLATLTVEAPVFVSTSSQEENPGHILDPRTGFPARTDILSATAIASTGAVSDLLSTALFVAGSSRARAILEAYPGAQAVLLVREGDALTLVASAGLEDSLDLDPAWAARVATVSFDLP